MCFCASDNAGRAPVRRLGIARVLRPLLPRATQVVQQLGLARAQQRAHERAVLPAHPAQLAQVAAAQRLQHHRLRLVVGVVAKRHRTRGVHTTSMSRCVRSQLAEERQALRTSPVASVLLHAHARLMLPAVRQCSEVERQSVLVCQCADEMLLALGFGAYSVIEMDHVELQPPAVLQSDKQAQQSDRVGATADGYDERLAWRHSRLIFQSAMHALLQRMRACSSGKRAARRRPERRQQSCDGVPHALTWQAAATPARRPCAASPQPAAKPACC